MKRISAALALSLLVLLPGLWAGGSEERQAGGGPRRTVLRIGCQPISNLDPHLATSTAEIQLLEQIYEHLTSIDPHGRRAPELATAWESADGRRWIFTLREGARFASGSPVTAADVVYSFGRLRDPEGDSPVASLYGDIQELTALDQSQVQFLLAEPNPEFPIDTADYHAAILPEGTRDPAGEHAGSGPFMIAFYVPGTQMVLRRNPYYDVRDEQGRPLPHLQELRFLFSADLLGQLEALQRGELDYVGGLTSEMVRELRHSRGVRVVTVDANMHWVIHMRSDAGHVGADNRVRRALKLATSQQALVDAVRPGLGSLGNGFTPVGPAFGMYHLVRPAFTDTRKARALLAEAGYGEGLEITLTVPDHPEALAIAAAWTQQVARAGVSVTVRALPPMAYYGREGDNWLNAEFAITDWGARPTALSYFKLAYVTGAPWNESHWSDPEFDGVVAAIHREMEEARRILLYHQAQEILLDRGPIIVAYFVKAAAALSSELRGLTLAADWPRTRFRDAYLD
jgi:peptide/nickel transport system substrate-binding protein